MLYNEPQKLSFINTFQNGSTRWFVTQLMERIAGYEQEIGRDFADMSPKEMRKAFSLISGLRSDSANNVRYLLSRYVSSIHPDISLEEILVSNIDKFRRSLLSSPNHLFLSMNELFPSPQFNTIEHIYRTFLWLAYIGFKTAQAIQIRASDVDLLKMVVVFQGLEYKIFPEAVYDMNMAVNLTEFTDPHLKPGCFKPRASGDLLLRGKPTDLTMQQYLEKTIRPTISRASNKLLKSYGQSVPDGICVPLSYQYIYLSGILYRAYCDEVQTGRVNFESQVKREMSQSDIEDSANYSYTKAFNSKIRGYERDYTSWKEAFYPDA